VPPEETVGIVGLGSLGTAVAGRLLAGGLDVVGFRRSDGEDFRKSDGRLCSSPREVFEAARVIFTCLPDETALLSVIDGEDGFLTSSARGRIVIDLSTTPLAPRFTLRDRLRQAASTLVDCPVSGLPAAVDRGKGVLLASADAAEFAAVEVYLRMVSDEVHYVGAFGDGTKLKYLANFLMVVHAAAAAEMVAAARAAGLDPALAVEVLSRGAGGSFQLASRGPGMAAQDYGSPQATLDQLTKDLRIIAQFHASVGLDSGLLSAAAALVRRAQALGFGGCDPTALVEAAQANLTRSSQELSA
jgi:3-hydroxyisobutyrate dehydrogenase-like beta-hydroxyacid dehydrogenase